MADQMNSTPKYVVSRTLTTADWQNSTLINGDVAARISELKQQPGRNIGMSGSSDLVSWLLRHGLLDRLDLLVFPVVLGSGKRLFSEPDGQVPLALASSEAFGTGVVHLTYTPASA
jgi:dihydrofolate reductase